MRQFTHSASATGDIARQNLWPTNSGATSVRIVAFNNTSEGWSRDVTEDIATELAQACADGSETPSSIADFIADDIQPSHD